MNVTFVTGTTNRYTTTLKSGKRVYFHKGEYSTTDKQEISDLLAHPRFRIGEIRMVTREDMVESYLNNPTQADYINEAFLDSLSADGIYKLGEIIHAVSTRPTLIRKEALEQPLTDAIKELVVNYPAGVKSIKEQTEAKAKKVLTPIE